MSAFRRVVCVIFLLLLARIAPAIEPGEVQILHDPLRCWPTDQFRFVDAAFEPPADLLTAKLYYRSAAQSDYYFVELTLGRDGRGRAILPMVEADAPGVVYFLELVTKSFTAFRTDETSVPVSSGSECQTLDPKSVFYTGGNPDIAVGATRAGVPALPPDFQANGIARFISVLGPTPPAGPAAGGGGVSGKTVGILAGGGGGAAALLFLGGNSEATTTGLGGNPTITSTAGTTTTVTGGGPTSTTTTVGGGAPSTTTTVSSGGPSSTTTTAVGPTTTTTGPGTTTTSGTGTSTSSPSSTTTSGPSTTTSGPSTTTTIGSSTTSSAGTSTTTSVPSTTSSSTTTSAATTTTSVGTNADIQVSKSSSGNPVIVNQVFSYFVTVTNNGPATATGVGMQDNLPTGMTAGFTSAPCTLGSTVICSLGTIGSGASVTVEIRVIPSQLGSFTNTAGAFAVQPDPNTSNNTASHGTTVVSSLKAVTASGPSTRFTSSLEIDSSEGGSGGRVLVNETTVQETRNGVVHVHHVSASSSILRVEGHLTNTVSGQGRWVFDFRDSPGFLPGSIRVESGNVISTSSHGAAFSVSEGAPVIRFTARLRNDDRER